jgi:hypothetical protein
MTSGLQSVIQLLKAAYRLYRSNFWNYLGIVAVPLLAGIFLAGVVLVLMTIFAIGLLNFSSIIGSLISFLIILLGVVLVVGAIVLQLWSPMALLVSATSPKPLSVFSSFNASRKYVVPYLIVSFLSGLVLFGAITTLSLPVLILLGLLGILPIEQFFSESILTVVGYLSVIILFLTSVVPGIIVAVWLNFVSYIIVVENKTSDALSVLSYSKELVRGSWWAVAGRMFFLIFIAALLPLIFGIITTLTGLEAMSYLYNIVSLVLAPLFIFYMLILYKNLVEVRGRVNDGNLQSSSSLIKKLMWVGVIILAIMFVVVLVAAVT